MSTEEYKEQNRGERPDDHRLPNSEIKDLLRKYSDEGLTEDREDGEFFVIRRPDGSALYFHKWKTIPRVAPDGTVQKPVPIEQHIKERLKESHET